MKGNRKRFLLILLTSTATSSILFIIALAWLVVSPVRSDDSPILFGSKIASKRIASEVIMLFSGFYGDSISVGTISNPAKPHAPVSLSDLPALKKFVGTSNALDFDLARETANWLRLRTVKGTASRNYRVLSTVETLEQSSQGQPFLCGDIVRLFIMISPALGLESRMVYLWDPGEANHVVAEVWSESLGKWAIVDVQENMILTKEDGIPLSAVELSDLVKAGRYSEVRFIPNGYKNFISELSKEQYLRKYSEVSIFLRSDFQRMAGLSAHHPANLESQNTALYEPAGSLLPNIYYRQGFSGKELSGPPN